MNRIADTLTLRIAKAAIRFNWRTQRAAERHRALGEHLEACAHRLAELQGYVDDALSALTEEAKGA